MVEGLYHQDYTLTSSEYVAGFLVEMGVPLRGCGLIGSRSSVIITYIYTKLLVTQDSDAKIKAFMENITCC